MGSLMRLFCGLFRGCFCFVCHLFGMCLPFVRVVCGCVFVAIVLGPGVFCVLVCKCCWGLLGTHLSFLCLLDVFPWLFGIPIMDLVHCWRKGFPNMIVLRLPGVLFGSLFFGFVKICLNMCSVMLGFV